MGDFFLILWPSHNIWTLNNLFFFPPFQLQPRTCCGWILSHEFPKNRRKRKLLSWNLQKWTKTLDFFTRLHCTIHLHCNSVQNYRCNCVKLYACPMCYLFFVSRATIPCNFLSWNTLTYTVKKIDLMSNICSSI